LFSDEIDIQRDTEGGTRPNWRRLSIKAVLGGVEVLDACFGDAVLAPELVSLGAVLGVAVGYDVSAEAATDDEDFPHFVM
jgi:hypothetical protein